MRTSVCLRGSVALLAAILPVVLHAQFQEPTQDELKMTADPAAPGAAAVYLYYEEIDNDPIHYKSIYARIKVLTDKGKDLATVDLPYESSEFKIRAIEGRTIHPDGTEYPLTTKPEDLMTSKSGDREMARKVFTLPNVTVGSILEYRYQIGYDDHHLSSPFWEIQRHYYVHKAHYSFVPFESFMPHAAQGFASDRFVTNAKGEEATNLVWWYNLPEGVSVKKGIRDYNVDIADVPPVPDEEYMPPIQSLLYKVFFYYSARDADDYWTNAAKSWSKDVDKFAETSKPIKDAVAGIVSPGDSEQVKAEKLYK